MSGINFSSLFIEKEKMNLVDKKKLIEFGFKIGREYIGENGIGNITIEKPQKLIYPKRILDDIDKEIIEFFYTPPLGLLEYYPPITK